MVVAPKRVRTRIDTGPILLKHACPLTEETYIGDVYADSREHTPTKFVEAADGLASGELEPTPQPSDPAMALRCYPRRPEDSRLDWSDSAIRPARVVRATAELLPGAYTAPDGERLTVWQAHAETPPTPVHDVPGQVTECRPETGKVAALTGNGFLVLKWVDG